MDRECTLSGMTDRELMVQLYGRVEALRDDVKEIKEQLRDCPCPSEMCLKHDRRLMVHDTYFRILGGLTAICASGLIVLIVELMVRG